MLKRFSRIPSLFKMVNCVIYLMGRQLVRSFVMNLTRVLSSCSARMRSVGLTSDGERDDEAASRGAEMAPMMKKKTDVKWNSGRTMNISVVQHLCSGINKKQAAIFFPLDF